MPGRRSARTVQVYSGDDASGLPAMAVGAYGIVSVASHVVGAEMKQMIDFFVGGDAQATQLSKLFPVFKVFSSVHSLCRTPPGNHCTDLAWIWQLVQFAFLLLLRLRMRKTLFATCLTNHRYFRYFVNFKHIRSNRNCSSTRRSGSFSRC